MTADRRVFHDPADPDESDLAGVPRVFTHSKCDKQTHLSAATVRRYESDPFRLVGAGSWVWCAGCAKNARSADCEWLETGESVRAYFRRLIGRAYLNAPASWIGRFFLLHGILAAIGVGVGVLSYLQAGGDAETARLVGVFGAAVMAVVVIGGALLKWRTYRKCAVEYQEYQGR